MAPPHSYIDALKYTPVQLAEYLKYLDGNDTAYNEYFWWKPYYKYEIKVYSIELAPIPNSKFYLVSIRSLNWKF